eukprot:TRINITY_DN864_c0_g1_i2.p1 TRINITY_DN864_c0_g1~~TRINITY_DN864_c0_g1_i2.p1  ORF type:complete len:800 (+),score=151.47 TRINITY_DN864_c0_g1_i2:45-2444(+)
MSGKRRYYPPTEDHQNAAVQQPPPSFTQPSANFAATSPSVPTHSNAPVPTFNPQGMTSSAFQPQTGFATHIPGSSTAPFPPPSQPGVFTPPSYGGPAPVAAPPPTSSFPPPSQSMSNPPLNTSASQEAHDPHGRRRVYLDPEEQHTGGFEDQSAYQPTNPNALASNMANMSLNSQGGVTPAQGGSFSHTPVMHSEGAPYSIAEHVQCPRTYLRMTLNAVPSSTNLLNKSNIPLGCVIHPMARPLTTEDQIPIINFGASGILRCRRCRGYINPFVSFTDGGRRWRCNLCSLPNDVPGDYFSPIDGMGRRQDLDERPELHKGCVEFVAPSEYMVRPPQPPCYLFVIDVGYQSISSGMFHTAIETIKRTLNDIPGTPRTRVGFITYDSTVHFYNLRASLSSPQMLVVADIDDVFLPLPEDMLVNLNESRAIIENLLSKFPTMFQSTHIVDSTLGVALKAGFEVLKNIGGKMIVLASNLPSEGLGRLKKREDSKLFGTDKETSLLLPEEAYYKNFALDCSRQQISVDTFLFPLDYIDVATLGCLPQFTGGQLYYYPGFTAAIDGERFYRDLIRDLTRETGFEAVFRVRTSKGLKATAHFGNFFIRSTDLLALPNVDADKAFAVQLALAENTITTNYVSFQAALLYTTSSGERRIRVFTQCLPVVSTLVEVFKAADNDAITTLTTKMAIEKALNARLSDAREAIVNKCIDILTVYRTDLAPATGNSGQLMLPETLKTFPLHVLALVKSVLFRGGTEIRSDERSYYLMHARTLPLSLTIPLLYGRMFAVHNLSEEVSVILRNFAW